jgi:hypothetical protein
MRKRRARLTEEDRSEQKIWHHERKAKRRERLTEDELSEQGFRTARETQTQEEEEPKKVF